jgi:rubrerythrin
MSKLRQMRSPKGTQVVNKHHYLVVQAEKVHGSKYDYSLIKEEDITFANKLKIVCPVHGVFHKRKSAHVTDREGCPHCSANRLRQLRKF